MTADRVVIPGIELTAVLRQRGLAIPVYDVGTALTLPAEPCLVLLTDWTPRITGELSRHARTGSGWLVPIRFDGGLALIGPTLGPDASCCLLCAEANRLRTLGSNVFGAMGDLRLGGRASAVPAQILGPMVLDAVAHPERYDGRVAAVRMDHTTISTHRIRPRTHGCDICSPVPVDTPEDARIALAPVRTTNPYALRADNPRTTREHLREVLFDWRHGPVAHVFRSERAPVPLAAAEIVGSGPVSEAGYGRSLTYAEAERVALFEAAERYTGGRPHAHRTVVEASFEQLGPDRALDPRRLGLPDLSAHGHAGAGYTPYTPQTPTRWVYGWSLGHRRAVAVPEHVAYWDVSRSTTARFVFESSSGCGVGNSLVEAALYGLFEVAERDAFLMSWYARTPLRRVAPPDDDAVLPHLADRLETVGYELMLFDATNDLDVPAVLVLASRREPDAHAPQAFFAAGAHPDPRLAMRAAAVEAVVNVFKVPEQARDRPSLLARERLLEMLAEPALVRTMTDHTALYTLPEARDRYEFLFGGDSPAAWQDLWPGRPAPVEDLADFLRTTVERLAALGLEVIVVDQSDPVLYQRTGLRSAKVIVPGTLPMTFGHLNRRTHGLPRLIDVPRQMGRLAAPGRYDDLPLHPHPFP